MPTVILDRIPLPNLKLYSTVSVLLLSCCLYYAIVTTSDPDWRALSAAAAPADEGEAEAAAAAVAALPSALDDAGDLTDGRTADGLSNASGLLGQCIGAAVGDVVPTSIELPADAAANVAATAPTPEQPAAGAGEATNAEPRSFSGHMKDVVAFMCQEAVCIWVSLAIG